MGSTGEIMGLYRIYIDEVGTHDLEHTDDPNNRFLSLTGVVVEANHMLNVIQPEMGRIKRKYFQTDPDIPVIFHRKELVNKRPPFSTLRDPKVEAEFNGELLDALERWQYKAVTVVIDKKALIEQYVVLVYHPYHYCMEVLLERYFRILEAGGNRGDVMVEHRNRREDAKLENSFRRLYDFGTDYVSGERFQTFLTSRNLKIKPKEKNIAGLQLADLIAHPSRREILLENKLIDDPRRIFGDEICEILRASKYHRSSQGRIRGYGKKLLP